MLYKIHMRVQIVVFTEFTPRYEIDKGNWRHRTVRVRSGKQVIRFGKHWKKPYGTRREKVDLSHGTILFSKERSHGPACIPGTLLRKGSHWYYKTDLNQKKLVGGERFEIEL